LHSVHYFDQAFGEFVDKLRDTGLLDRSVILVYGDHQGFLGDRELANSLDVQRGMSFGPRKSERMCRFLSASLI
jgi:arylsulfatase A-like enzyme